MLLAKEDYLNSMKNIQITQYYNLDTYLYLQTEGIIGGSSATSKKNILCGSRYMIVMATWSRKAIKWNIWSFQRIVQGLRIARHLPGMHNMKCLHFELCWGIYDDPSSSKAQDILKKAKNKSHRERLILRNLRIEQSLHDYAN